MGPMRRSLLPVIATLILAAGCGGNAAPSGGAAAVAGKPASLAELAMYQGADRTDILTKGAQAEGKITLYSSNSSMEQFSEEFMKKYPFIKVENYRTQGTDLLNR